MPLNSKDTRNFSYVDVIIIFIMLIFMLGLGLCTVNYSSEISQNKFKSFNNFESSCAISGDHCELFLISDKVSGYQSGNYEQISSDFINNSSLIQKLNNICSHYLNYTTAYDDPELSYSGVSVQERCKNNCDLINKINESKQNDK